MTSISALPATVADDRSRALTGRRHDFFICIMIVRNHTLELDRIKRSNRLDVFGARPLPTGTFLPDQFIQTECSPAHTAAVVKFMYHERGLRHVWYDDSLKRIRKDRFLETASSQTAAKR